MNGAATVHFIVNWCKGGKLTRCIPGTNDVVLSTGPVFLTSFLNGNSTRTVPTCDIVRVMVSQVSISCQYADVYRMVYVDAWLKSNNYSFSLDV